jgi:hypothetical protein
LGLLLLGRLVGVLLVLVVADSAGRAGDNGGGRRRPHEAGASASHHVAGTSLAWLGGDGFVGVEVEGGLDDVARDPLDVDEHAARVGHRVGEPPDRSS